MTVTLPPPAPILNIEETLLLEPFMVLAKRRGLIRTNSILLRELPWRGNRVDIAVLSPSLLASAFELKIGSISRAIEQASYNRLAFDRSWVVVPETPRRQNLDEAQGLGIGLIQVSGGSASVVQWPSRESKAGRELRSQLRNEIRRRSS